MRGLKIFPLITLLPLIFCQTGLSPPICALRCWENTQYVSKCAGEIGCLCGEPNYQKSVFQCLYSQCDTAHFGSALHHVISQCFNTGNQITFAVPPIPNRDLLHRREAEYIAGDLQLMGSGSAAGYPTESAGGFPIQSAFPTQSAGSLPTQSALYPTPSVLNATQIAGGSNSSGVASSSILSFPLSTATGSVVTSAIQPSTTYKASSSSAMISVTQSPTQYQALPASTTAIPQLYTGLGSSMMPTFSLALLVILIVIPLNG